MSTLYERIETLGKRAGYKNMQQLCTAAGVPRATMTELKKGRTQSLREQNATKFCSLLGITLDELYGRKIDTIYDKPLSDDELKFALFGGEGEITDEMLEQVKKFAEFVRQQNLEKNKRD